MKSTRLNEQRLASRPRELSGVMGRLLLGIILVGCAVPPLRADTTRTQNIVLHRGWNAVFLEVYPLETSPSVVFSNTPVDIVASYYAHASTAQFMVNPGGDLFKKQGWGVWYAEKRPEAFLKSLHAIYGQQGYLIHAQSDWTWSVSGGAVPASVRWQPNAYNFVGFAVSPQAPPTFDQFFSGSPAHHHNQIYRLQAGVWERVLDPSAEAMRSGEAFWIYCHGPSKYQGPLAVETVQLSGLLLGAGGDALTLRNETDHPVTATVEHVPSGSNCVPLSIVVQLVGAADQPVRSVAAPKPGGAWTQALPPLEAGGALQVPFEARSQDAQTEVQSSLLKVTTDLGTEAWIPVATLRADLKQTSTVDANPYRGLWVGQVNLKYVNEVSIPLNSNNVPVAPDPLITTPTADAAQLRLILHVNGAGQVSLLKDVAVLNRHGGTNLLTSESDLALVTDETLYGQFPPQPAQRIASAAFDFGDSQATAAVEAVMDAAVSAVAGSVATNTADLASAAGRTSAENAAAELARAAGNPIVASANVAEAFNAFLQSTNFNSAVVSALAASADPAADAQPALVVATNLQNQSFYRDTRAVEMIHAVLDALALAGSDPAERMAVAQNTAASFDDIANSYQRFIAGKEFGDMIASAAAAAAQAAVDAGATSASISNAVTGDAVVNDARTIAVQLRSTRYTDTRGRDAIEQVLAAVTASAEEALPATNLDQTSVQKAAEQAGQEALATTVKRYPLASQPPTPDYNDFIVSSTFLGSVDTAATAAAAAAVLEKKNNALWTASSLANEARLGAVQALESVLGAAARAVRNELPMEGTFAPGAGDSRLTWDIKQTNTVVALGEPALTAAISLPASHPTNPFRHRRHPDHTVGYDITRNLRLDFDTLPGEVLPRAGYGVDRVSGVYREEIFGLHKPLGPQQDIGLRVEGTFELNRISLIDTLNAR